MNRWMIPCCIATAVALSGCGSSGGGDPAAGNSAAPAGNPVQATRLAPNQALSSNLSAANPRLASFDPEIDDRSLFQAYEITLTAPGTLTLLMRSNDLDSHLQLFDASFLTDPTDDSAFLAESDDVGSSLHAMISEWLPAGTYVVLAGSAYGNAADTGTYSLMSLLTP